MAWSKMDVIKEAYAEIGKSDYDFDLSPEALQAGLRRLDAMMASWGGSFGIRIGYGGGDGFGEISADTEVPDWAYDGLYLNLAIRLAPSFGKTVSPETRTNAKMALDGIMARTVPVAPRNIGGGYAGSGGWRRGNLVQPVEPLTSGQDGFIILGGGV
jgi:P22 tail accessory factor